jgi:hypothetical protein
MAFTLFLAGGALSAFGQATNQSITDPPAPAEPVQTLIPVHLDPATGDIKVGRTTYHGGNPGLHLLALKRQVNAGSDTPDLIRDQTFTDASSANQFLLDVINQTSDALLIANGVGNYGSVPNSVLMTYGGTTLAFSTPGSTRGALSPHR